MKKLSKFLSLVLRHRPDSVGIELDEHGWVRCDELLAAAAASGMEMDYGLLCEVVRTSDKQRFALSDDGKRIRANQGHSVKVDLALDPVQPPEFLKHGTVERFLDAIRREGLIKGQRHHVHLSPDQTTAEKVGRRRGQAVILTISSGEMWEAGYKFYRSDNGVWLVDHVPPSYIVFS